MALPFTPSARSTIGVEWELQLIDQDSNDLRQAADAVIERATVDGSLHPFVQREMMLNTIEITSGARRTVAECLDDIVSTGAFLRGITNPLRIDLATAGTHPFARPAYQRVTNSHRYEELVERTQYWGRQMLLYGIHVHVGIEDRAKVLPIQSALVTRLGQMQALSASSPFWAGQDTGYASNRAMVFQQLPTAGIPRQFGEWEELERYVDDMTRTGVIGGFDEIRWDVRPAPKWGTVENRVFDAATNIQEVGAFAALTHCLVEYFSRRLDDDEGLASLPDWFVAENKWRSARYGMDAELILDRSGREEPVVATVERMLEELAPVARDLGCERELEGVETILRMGAGYQRQRYVAAHAGRAGLDAVVELMRAEMRADRPLDPAEFLNARPSRVPGSAHGAPA
ncbi:MAG: glutamate--cysteine ligase [Actinomyces sp.]|jgi:carboxylate-amine ligase|nr:glutamate--cysteine ligase [Actinomyces sp.]MCI1641634.1 glutamate--cysteine ligase [Actinomyces sp.]MCI1661893.1 glutamate--cysteine ligase [Actinomyces sp.]MCI1690735.1 glutamate--cysteine ligase [Actinomyces sp.]MCI1787537.1 glutamate--cysteine ligase [Actinomyces sp.]MCI1829193.1 glutamate--cysteine ligase [Actinomyces sp.]